MPGPMLMRDVAPAIAVNVTNTSRVINPSSNTQHRSYPSSSAITAAATTSATGAFAIRLTDHDIARCAISAVSSTRGSSLAAIDAGRDARGRAAMLGP